MAGTVSDQSGGRIPSAVILVAGLDSKFNRQTKTNPEGAFRIELLPPGRYQIKTVAPGFAETAFEINIPVSSIPTLSITLRPAALKQSVSVMG